MLLPDGTFLVWFFVAVLFDVNGIIQERFREGPIVGHENCQKMVEIYEDYAKRRDLPSQAYCKYAILKLEELQELLKRVR